MKKVIVIAVICAGIVLGWWLVEVWVEEEHRRLASADAGIPGKSLIPHKSHPTESGQDEPHRDADALSTESLAHPDEQIEEGYSALANDIHRTRALRRGNVSQEIIELLELSPQEVDRLNELVRTGVDQLSEVELDRVKVVSASEEEVVLRVPAHPEEGREVAEAIHHGVLRIVGEDRGMQFMKAMNSSIPLFWNDFGHFDRTVTFSVEPRGSGEYWVEFRQDLPEDQVEAYYGRPISNEVSVWPGFGKLIFADRTDFVGPSLGRARYLLPVLPEGMRSLFELMEEPSAAESEAYRKRFGLD